MSVVRVVGGVGGVGVGGVGGVGGGVGGVVRGGVGVVVGVVGGVVVGVVVVVFDAIFQAECHMSTNAEDKLCRSPRWQRTLRHRGLRKMALNSRRPGGGARKMLHFTAKNPSPSS